MKRTIPKEYAIVISLIIFFTLVILVGTIRIVEVTKARLDKFDLEKIDVVETSTNVDMKSINLSVKNAMAEKYNIDIYYGENLHLENVNAVAITDESKIFEMLKEINEALAKYPYGIIKEMQDKGYSLSIYLVDYFTNNIEALANRNTIGQFKIYMSNTFNIERAVHHEYYHILDYYIRLESDESIAYSNWYIYNPIGFVYEEDIDNITSDNVYKKESGANFVTLYSKYSEKEDRAETFSEMVTADRSELFFGSGEPIKGKMDIIRDVLRNTFKVIKLQNKLAWE